ncbi:MAG: hypothetical protein ABIA62_04350 [Candidatus Woesearchaeota archaeon]
MPKKTIRALDKATKSYYRREGLFATPGFILGYISVAVIITGIWINLKTLIAIGILILAIAAYLHVMGKTAFKTIFRK